MIKNITSGRKENKFDLNIIYSKYPAMNLFSLGYNYFYEMTKVKLSVLDKFKDKKKIYKVHDTFSNYFIDDDNLNKLSRDYFKFVEITSLLENKYSEIKFNIITKTIEDDLKKAIETNKKKYTKKSSSSALFFIETFKSINRSNKKIVNIIFNTIESSSPGDSLIVKLPETFNSIYYNILYILSVLYNKVNLIKPTASNEYKIERYVVCENLKKDCHINRNNKIPKNTSPSENDKLDVVDVEIIEKKSFYETKLSLLDEKTFDKNVKNSLFDNLLDFNSNYLNQFVKKTNDIKAFVDKGIYLGGEFDSKKKEGIDNFKKWADNYLN